MARASVRDIEPNLWKQRSDSGRRGPVWWSGAAAVVMTLALLNGCSCEIRDSKPDRGRFMVHGHRGCRGLRPENTLPAFKHAAWLGVDFLELDLGLTRDRVLVVNHDPVINPDRCQVPPEMSVRWIKDLSWPEIRALSCEGSSTVREGAPRVGIPRLEQVLALLEDHPRLGANIEIKTFPDHPSQTWPPEEFAGILVRILRERGLSRRVIVQSFDPRALAAVSQLAPEIAISALVGRRAEFSRILRETGARILSPRYTELRREDLRDLGARGIMVVPWTVNDPDAMTKLITWGVDGIITDRPDLLLRILKRGRPGVAEVNSTTTRRRNE